MINVHERLHRLQQKNKASKAADGQSADDLVSLVTHISDAIIMKRIFSVLFARGAVIVATSNRPPEDLYLNGLNRPLFLPFIPMLRDFTEVHAIGADVDYRMISTS